MTTALDEVKTFHDPHPGLLGAVARIPEPVRQVANELNGSQATLQNALSRIEAVIKGRFKLEVYEDCILLLQGIHTWRVIRFR